ncbi:MAG: hypothetical protein EA356_08865 [Geminicoccaceae bacterium]|nr:MAG: hypothetical protein EA356_08865 [Geminicoccaceae bacterium]
MTRASSLRTLQQWRERQRDAAHAALGNAQRTLAAFEAKRKAWRQQIGAEAAPRDGDAPGLALLGWVEAARTREWRGEAEAAQLRLAVREADAAFRAADLALEQLTQLQQRQAARDRQDAARRLQKRVDDLQRGGMLDDAGALS